MSARLPALCLALLLPSTAFGAELIDRIVAVVNKDVILLSELSETLEVVEDYELRGLAGDERTAARDALQTRVLDTLIGQELMDQAMEGADVQVGERDVDNAIADIARQNSITIERVLEEVAKQGLDESSYRAELKDQLRQFRFMEMTIRGRINVTEADVRNRWQQVRGDDVTAGRSWRLQRLLLSWGAAATDEDKAAIREEGARLLETLRGGADFAEAARVRSDDASTKEAGGDAGVLRPSDLSPAFRDALAAVEVGTPVLVETPMGAFLLRVAEAVDTSEEEFLKAWPELRRQLEGESMDRELELWTEEERRKAHVEILL